ncbi:MAG: sugar transferase [Candidatus Microthrix sp.]|nr:sugar transferase [Candidatus Microthrix sp.]
MVIDAEARLAELDKAERGRRSNVQDERHPRITRVGRRLRRASFDELLSSGTSCGGDEPGEPPPGPGLGDGRGGDPELYN